MAERYANSPRSLARSLYIPEDSPEYRGYMKNPEDYYDLAGAAAQAAMVLPPGAGSLVSGGINAARATALARAESAARSAPRTLALPAPRPKPNAWYPDEMLPAPPVIHGRSAEGLPRLENKPIYPRDTHTPAHPLDTLANEGGPTQDAVDAARAASRRAAEQRAQARVNEVDTFRGEGPNASEEVLRQRHLANQERQLAAQREKDFIDRQLADMEGEGGGAFNRYNRPPGRGFEMVNPPGTALARRDVGSEPARIPGTGFTGEFPRSNLTDNAPTTALATRPNGTAIDAFLGRVAETPQSGSIDPALRYALGLTGALGAGTVASGIYTASQRPSSTPPEQPAAQPASATGASVPPQAPTAVRPADTDVSDFSRMDYATPPTSVAEFSRMDYATPPAQRAVQTARTVAARPAPARTAAPAPAQSDSGGILGKIFSGKDYQSSGGELQQKNAQGRDVLNWGDSDSSADFFRAAARQKQLEDAGTDYTGSSGSDAPQGRAAGGKVDNKPSKEAMLHKALEIIHHMIKR